MLIPLPVSCHKPLLTASHLMTRSSHCLMLQHHHSTVYFHPTSHFQKWTMGESKNLYGAKIAHIEFPLKKKTKTFFSEKIKEKSPKLEILWVVCNNRRACIPNCAFEKTIWRGLISLMWLTHELRPSVQSRNKCGGAAFHLLSAQHQPNHFCSCQKHLRSQVIFNFPQRER